MVGERHSFVIAKGGQRFDHPVVPVPAGWDDAGFDGEAVNELLHPLPQIGGRLGSFGLCQRRPVERAGELAERILERVDFEAELVLSLHDVNAGPFRTTRSEH
jgi:hypothetical protein